MPQQQTIPIVVPEDRWWYSPKANILDRDGIWFTQLDWMVHRKEPKILTIRRCRPEYKLELLQRYYVINDLDIRNIQEQEAAGNYFLMSLYVNTMVFDKAVL